MRTQLNIVIYINHYNKNNFYVSNLTALNKQSDIKMEVKCQKY